MLSKKLSWLLAGMVLAATAAMAGCGHSHVKTLRSQALENWNAARIKIMYQLAHQQYETREYKKCRKTLQQAFATGFSFEPLHVLAAKVDIEQGRLLAASKHLKTAVQINGLDPKPYYLLGIIYQRWQKDQAAHDYYQLAWQRKPDSALYMLAVVEMKIAMGRYASAHKLLKRKLIYFEESSAVRAALARLCMIAKKYPRASHYYRQALLLSPTDDNLRMDLAESYYLGRRYRHAVRVLRRLKREKPGVDRNTLLLLLGESYVNLNQPIPAHDCFDTLTAHEPHDAMVWVGLAKASMQIHDFLEARIALGRALKYKPNNVHAWMLLALVQEKQQRWKQAVHSLLKAEALAPRSSTVLCMLGLAARHDGKKQVAQVYFQRALKANPADHWAQKLLRQNQGPKA